jgi:ATP-dependent Clp protease adaptor protein ClpS
MPVDTSLPPTKTIPATEFVVVTDEELERPYRVIIENDDVTPMDFVVLVLEMIFELDETRAQQVMLEAHNRGRAHVVTLPFEDARQRVYTAQSLARQFSYPLRFYLEPED